jgi:hypothetical protein
VPTAPPGYAANSATNNYVGGYLNNSKKKYRKPGDDIHQLKFQGNHFEGCVRVEEPDGDDNNTWWTAFPYGKHDTAKALLISYDSGQPQRWEKLDDTFVENVVVPVNQLADTPDEL